MDTQSSRAVLMVRPVSFGFDDQTAQSNTFQNKPTTSQASVRKQANDEFQQAVDTLLARGIDVTVFEDAATAPKPNAVFPNNWLSTWPDGTLYLYPMATESRRIERSERALALLKDRYEVGSVIDLSDSEHNERYLESTGVMIFDHVHKIAYGCISVRCDEALFTTHATKLGYTPVLFHAYDENGIAIYHTNVMMGIQSTTAVICLEAITDESERIKVATMLEDTGHRVVEISLAQMKLFCGNVLELQNNTGEFFLALSQTAYDHFTPAQRIILSHDKTLLPLAIPTIEAIGGGSVRCMLAEIYLPTKRGFTP